MGQTTLADMMNMAEPFRWKIAYLADVGTTEPFVARITLGLSEVLDATLYPIREEIRTAIMGVARDCLIPAFVSLRELRKSAGDATVPLVTKTKAFDDICRYLWSAYKDRAQMAAHVMGYEIGFLFQEDPLFEKGCKEFPKANPRVRDVLIAVMKHNRATWQPDLKRFRNDYLEHHKIPREDMAAFYSLERAEVLFQRVWVAIEEILALLLEAGLHPASCLREIPEAERNPLVPKRFGFALLSMPPKENA